MTTAFANWDAVIGLRKPPWRRRHRSGRYGRRSELGAHKQQQQQQLNDPLRRDRVGGRDGGVVDRTGVGRGRLPPRSWQHPSPRRSTGGGAGCSALTLLYSEEREATSARPEETARDAERGGAPPAPMMAYTPGARGDSKGIDSSSSRSSSSSNSREGGEGAEGGEGEGGSGFDHDNPGDPYLTHDGFQDTPERAKGTKGYYEGLVAGSAGATSKEFNSILLATGWTAVVEERLFKRVLKEGAGCGTERPDPDRSNVTIEYAVQVLGSPDEICRTEVDKTHGLKFLYFPLVRTHVCACAFMYAYMHV
eukprot:GHVU01190589.1.p1 GENE.GHVU01190589.1~~GHVU01190589.1.p1  ORF type:complete len:334 (-),score=57.92 GHVU01190589.1:2081-3001(-)